MAKYKGNKYTMTREGFKKMLRESGTLRQMAMTMKCSIATVSRIAHDLGVKLEGRGRKVSQLKKSDIKPYTKGHTWTEIGIALGCSASAVRSAFRRFDLKKADRRNKGETFWCENKT